MNQKQAEPKKIVKIINEPISIKESITLSELFVKWGNRRIRSLLALMGFTTLIASVSTIAGYFVPLWVGIIVAVALSVGACYAFDKKIPIEVHKITKR